MTLVIRPATPDDVSNVRNVVDAAYRHYVERIGAPPAPMLADYPAAVRDRCVWVLDIDDDIRAVLVMRDAPDHLLVDNIAVQPDHQGIGLGSALLDFAEQHARDHGLSEVRLYTNEQMTENLRFYPRRGYVETGRHSQDGFARVYFSKTL